MRKIEHLVVDANAFVKSLPLQDMGENIYTVPEVVSEIRDAATRQRLQVLPYDLKLKEPLPEDIQFITKFSKATGDYASLSAVDIRLIALAYQLTKEKIGPEATETLLKTEPDVVKTETVMGAGNDSDKKGGNESIQNQEPVTTMEASDGEIPLEASEGVEVDVEPESENDEDDDDEGWITPKNYKQKTKELEGATEEEENTNSFPVACLTTDFAMQNVMMHVGMKVMSHNGLLIKNIRTYILRCYACFRTTSVMTKSFCPSCGNKTLKKVSVSMKPDGTLVIHLSRRVNLSGRGKKYPLPAPKGGKHSNNPILSEDQRIPQQRPSKMALEKNNPLGTDYIANSSPFTVNDVYSRAAVLGINTKYSGTQYWEKKNPNEAHRRTGKKKKN